MEVGSDSVVQKWKRKRFQEMKPVLQQASLMYDENHAQRMAHNESAIYHKLDHQIGNIVDRVKSSLAIDAFFRSERILRLEELFDKAVIKKEDKHLDRHETKKVLQKYGHR